MKLAVLVDPTVQMSGMAFEAMVIFMEHLFRTLGVRHIYADITKPNMAQFASGAGRWFEVCGVLREQLFVSGRYEDLVIVKVTREAWDGNASVQQLLHGDNMANREMEGGRG